MSNEEILKAISKVIGLQGMTLNERLYVTALLNEFESCRFSDKEKALFILDSLVVDKLSIEIILKNSSFASSLSRT